MEFQNLTRRAMDIRQQYAELEKATLGRSWTPEQVAMGFVGDVGDLIKLVMAHSGGHPWANGDWQRAIAVAGRYENLLLDTATSQIDNGMLERAVAELGPKRIVFGTDMPLLDPYTQLARVTGADISDEAKALILGGNYQRILGLS